jgi:hypothetical protein
VAIAPAPQAWLNGSVWARWVLAIGLGAILLYVGVVHGLIRRDISRSKAGATVHVRGGRAALAGSAIGIAGLALVALGGMTALSWHAQLLFYGLWAIAGLGTAAFFYALRAV